MTEPDWTPEMDEAFNEIEKQSNLGKQIIKEIKPQREWVGLTPADFDWLEQVFGNKVSNNFVLAEIVCVISSKLKDKNT
jgi:hypothetical protein